ncbi:hypothetical protein [Ramlibacter sp.]|uniref:hypothetical protein n=1 Tax=Ramlibacter sp. TaxID=1917967 RepID=UPI003D12328A
MAKRNAVEPEVEPFEEEWSDEDIFVGLMTGNKDLWTKEFAEFVLRVGVKHRMRESQGEKPLALDHGKWKPTTGQKALALLAPHGHLGHCHVDPPRAHPGRVATWSFEALWPDREAKLWRAVAVQAQTLGIVRVVREFWRFEETGEFSETALMDRRSFEQEKVDIELQNAVADRDIDKVRRALAKGADPDCDQGFIGLAAKVATVHDEALLPILRVLIEGGAALEGVEIGDKAWSSQPPLWAAAREENLPAVKLLLELGADPACVYDGRSVLDFDEDGGYDPDVGREIKEILRAAVVEKERTTIKVHIPEASPEPEQDVRKDRWKKPGGPI